MTQAVADNFVLLRSNSSEQFEEFFAIYSSSLDKREQKPRQRIEEMVTRDDYTVVLVERGGSVIGFSILYLAEDQKFALLEYMAVAHAARGQGVGARLFRHSMSIVQGALGPVPVILEVDSDREPSDDRLHRRRRLEFYNRLGCLRIVGCDYLLPLLSALPLPTMDLLVYRSDQAMPISRSALRGWIQAIYQNVYQCSSHDPRIARMLQTVSDPVELAAP